MKRTSSKASSKASEGEVLIPMHADNWALSLGSGYIGPDFLKDRADDIQSPYRNHILAFRGSVPAAAVEGESKVVLSVALTPPSIGDGTQVVLINDLIRITSVKSASFQSEADLKNFMASYGLFPDVPVKLVDSFVGSIGVSLLDIELPNEPEGRELAIARKRRDYFGGWAAGLVELISTTPFADEVGLFLRSVEGEHSVYSAASALLVAFHPHASSEDKAIWSTTIEVLSECANARGFDRESLLDEISNRITSVREVSGTVLRVWIETCESVVRALVDPPALDDRKSIGQRAALGAILAPDFQSSSMLGTTIEVGPRVKALVTIAAYAFEGLGRLPSTAKNDRPLLDFICDLAENLDFGRPSQLRTSHRSISNDYEVVRAVFVGTRRVSAGKLEENEFERAVIHELRKQGIVSLSDEGRAIVLGAKGTQPTILEEFSYADGTAGIRLSIAVGSVNSKITATQLKVLLLKAWEVGCSLGLSDTKGSSQHYVFDVMPLSVLNTASLTRVANSLQSVMSSISSKEKKLARPTKVRRKIQDRLPEPNNSQEG